MQWNEKSLSSIRTAVIIGFILSLSIGFLDATIGLLFHSPRSLSFSFILAPLVTTVSAFSLTYFILFVLATFFERFIKIRVIPLTLSVTLFLGTLFTFINLPLFSKYPGTSYKMLVLFPYTFLLATGVYFITKDVFHMSKYKETIVAFCLAVPFLLAETMVFIWLYFSRLEGFFSIKFFLLSVFYIVTALLILYLFYSISKKFSTRLFIAFLIFVVSSPLLALMTTTLTPKYPLRLYNNKFHQIKRIILITVDTLRADALSCYGAQNISTPHIDLLADDGILFSKAISPSSWTLPSIVSIMTGLSPAVHMTMNVKSKLPDTVVTLAEYMRDSGYITVGIVRNSFLKPDRNISQGFLDYKYYPKWGGENYSFGTKFLNRIFPGYYRGDVSTSYISELTINWLESNYEKDFFLWVHYFDPHHPYDPPVDFLPDTKPPTTSKNYTNTLADIRKGSFVPSLKERKWIKNLYLSETRYVDDNIGKLLDTLKRLDIYDESLIVFTSDHGEEFWEHYGFEHGHTLYNELLWVPLIIKLPLSASKGKIVKVVPTQSIMPTILELSKIDYESDRLSVGSLSPLWAENFDAYKEKPIVSKGLLYFEDRESVIFDNMKYIRFLLTDREELYDLGRDPKEKISITTLFPDKVRKGRSILKEHNEKAKNIRELYTNIKTEEVKLDEDTKKELKSLGYIQ